MAGARVLIIGGGLSGLAAAVALRHHGVDVLVCERASELRPAGSIIGVAANAARALERSGVGHIVENACIPMQRIEYVDWRGRYLTQLPIADVAKRLGTRTFIAYRADVQLALLDALEPGTVQLQRTCVAFEEDDAGVTARFSDGGTERGEVLLGCDGLRSAVRAQLHGDEPQYAGYSGWRGVTAIDPTPVEPGVGRHVLGRGRTFGVFGLTGGRIYWFASARMEPGLGDSDRGRKNDVRETFRGAPELVRSAIEATDEEAILRNDIFEQPLLERWGTRRATLLGDAAHATTPNTGEGGSHAILDGVSAAELLASVSSELDDAAAVERALREYEAEAIPRTSDAVKRAREIGTFLHFQNRLLCLVRDRIAYKALPRRVWEKRSAVYLDASR